jgi:hypothetical protein
LDQVTFRLPKWQERLNEEKPEITPEDVIALWRNPLFQRFRAEVENYSARVRGMNPLKVAPQEIKDKLMVMTGMERALEVFDDIVTEALGKRGKKTTEEAE